MAGHDRDTPVAHIELERATTEPGTRLGYTLRNTGSVPIQFGEMYELERMAGDGWSPVRLPYAFRAIGYGLLPGQERALAAMIPDDLPLGRYRLRKQISLDYERDPDRRRRRHAARTEVTAEFELTRSPSP